jgi:hypothetical protein
MNMDEVVLLLDSEVPNPANHPEIPRIERVSTPFCLPDTIKRGSAQLVLLNSICESINAPPLALKVPGNREKKSPKRYRDRCYKKNSGFGALAAIGQFSRHLPDCRKRHREEQGR